MRLEGNACNRKAKFPGAIGYEEIWNLKRFNDKGAVKVLKIDGVSPRDSDALLSGAYPFYRVHNVTTWNSAETKKTEAHALVRLMIRSGPVPLSYRRRHRHRPTLARLQ